MSATIQIDCDFPGGNIIVDGVDGQHVRVRQDQRDTERPWFYWHFRVRGAEGQTLTFTFTQQQVIGASGPGISRDGGWTWSYAGAESVQGKSFSYAFEPDDSEVHFSFGMPYTQRHLHRFLEKYVGNASLICERLCTSRGGRPVEMLRAGRTDGSAEHKVVLAARHHCCEMMANYEIEGVLQRILAPDMEGVWWRDHVEWLVIPFTDKDGVEQGDQGKGRLPRDHGRDYLGESIYTETAAIRERVPSWGNGRIRLALDLHCPHIRGNYNETIYFVGTKDEDDWRRTTEFAAIMESCCTGPLPYKASNNLPFGVAWNTAANYEGGKGFKRWAAEQDGIALAASIEFPYANVGGVQVTADGARAFGRDLAAAIRQHLMVHNT